MFGGWGGGADKSASCWAERCRRSLRLLDSPNVLKCSVCEGCVLSDAYGARVQLVATHRLACTRASGCGSGRRESIPGCGCRSEQALIACVTACVARRWCADHGTARGCMWLVWRAPSPSVNVESQQCRVRQHVTGLLSSASRRERQGQLKLAACTYHFTWTWSAHPRTPLLAKKFSRTNLATALVQRRLRDKYKTGACAVCRTGLHDKLKTSSTRNSTLDRREEERCVHTTNNRYTI